MSSGSDTRVLLLGELSGVHRYLGEGLREQGCRVTVAARSDGFKKIQADFSFDLGLTGTLGGILSRIRELQFLVSSRGFDVCQVANAFSFAGHMASRNLLLSQIQKASQGFFLLGAGSDAFFWRNGRHFLKAGLFDDYLKFDLRKESSPLETEEAYRFNSKIADLSSGVIPVAYEYEVSYLNHPKRLKTIPLPVNTDSIPYRENFVGKKIKVFHGLNRYGFKGTRLVEVAFDVLASRYPRDLDLRIVGRLPMPEYLDAMSTANVVLDQMYSHSLGINGIQAMAMGKVVLGGVEDVALKSLGVDTSPAISLQPTVESIIAEVEHLLDTRDSFQERGFAGRMFAENVHGHVRVAEKYLDAWRNQARGQPLLGE